MREELDLTSEQVDRIDAILREHFETLEKLREAAWPKISEVFESMKAGVDTVLTEQQRSDWEKYTERLERMFRRGMHRGPGEGFRDRRGPFRGPDGSGPGDERGPRQWRRDRLRPGDGAGPRRGRRDANAVSPPPEPEMERMPPSREPEPNAP